MNRWTTWTRCTPSNLEPESSRIDSSATVSLSFLLTSYLKIGSIGFGGGRAVVALMEQEFVRKRRLIPHDEFVYSVGLGPDLHRWQSR